MGSGERGTLKKLIGAARHWLGVDKPPAKPLAMDAGVLEGLRVFGVSEADIEAAQAHEVGEVADKVAFEVHEDAWESWLFYLKVQRQWVFVPVTRSVGMGGVCVDAVRYSMNWPGVESVARMSGVRRARWAGLLDDLQLIEDAVLQGEAERASAADG